MKTNRKFILVLLSCFVQLITVYCGSNDLIKSWENITENYTNDIQQSNLLYEKIKEEQRTLAELRIIVERRIRNKNAGKLINALSSYNISSTTNELQEVLNAFDKNYDSEMVDSIITTSMSEMFLSIPSIKTLPQLLWNIYQPNNSRSFELMLRVQLKLYNAFGQKYHTDQKEFLFMYAYILHKIQQDPLYKPVDLSFKLKIQNIIEQLPYNLKYLYFMPYFCLRNIKYYTYIYTAIEMKVDPLSRYIWLWRDTRSMDDTGYIKAEIGEVNMEDAMKLNVTLKGVKYDMYYYMMPNTMKIAGWEYSYGPLNYVWEMEFLEKDRVVFSQYDYLMCAVENHDNDRRNVGGRKRGQVSSMNSACQWRLGECDFKTPAEF